MTEAQHWRKIARWVAEQPPRQGYYLPTGLWIPYAMARRLYGHVRQCKMVPYPWKSDAHYQTYIIMRCEMLALEAEEEGR
jgi:hypothetical protein